MLAVLLGLLVSCATEDAAEKTQETTVSDPPTYVSLGDSLAVGVGATEPRERGFAPLYRDALEERTGQEVRFVQLGVSGETSESFIGSYPDAEGSQLARAEKALDGVPRLHVSLSIGGNDLLRTAELPDSEREEALDAYAENLGFILGKLRSASEPDARIATLALYNPAPGTFTDEWVGKLNARTRAVAQEHGVEVAAADRAFQGREDVLIHWERYRDIHPTDEGYEVLAGEFATALSGSTSRG